MNRGRNLDLNFFIMNFICIWDTIAGRKEDRLGVKMNAFSDFEQTTIPR